MIKLKRFLSDLLFPPKCISCYSFCKKDLLDPCEAPLCDKCRLEWEREKAVTCAKCGRELLSCRCSSGRMEKAGVSESIKLIFYQGDKETVGRRSILHLKKNRTRRAFDFFAAQLSFPLQRYMRENNLGVDNVCFCYVPRSYKSDAHYGLDQAEQLCRSLSRQLGIPYVSLFYRVGTKEAEQKTLSAREREKNVKGRFAINECVWKRIHSPKCIFLVDDVITTGASISVCTKLLRERYHGEIVAVSLAKTPLLRQKGLQKV